MPPLMSDVEGKDEGRGDEDDNNILTKPEPLPEPNTEDKKFIKPDDEGENSPEAATDDDEDYELTPEEEGTDGGNEDEDEPEEESKDKTERVRRTMTHTDQEIVTNTTPDITPADTNVTPEVSYESGYTLQIPDMTKLGTFHGEMDKLGTFSVTQRLVPL